MLIGENLCLSAPEEQYMSVSSVNAVVQDSRVAGKLRRLDVEAPAQSVRLSLANQIRALPTHFGSLATA